MDTDSDQLANLHIFTNSKCDFNSDLDGENEHRCSCVIHPSCSNAFINELTIVSALFTISWLFRVCVS